MALFVICMVTSFIQDNKVAISKVLCFFNFKVGERKCVNYDTGGWGDLSFLKMSAASFQGVSNLVNMYQGLSNTRPEKVKMTNEHPYAVGSEQLSEDGQ